MKTLLFVRHAESEANLRTDVIGGRANHVELTERGIEQAKRVGRYFAERGYSPQLVYRSPAVRTMQTAEYALLAGNIYSDMYIHDGLQEMSQGIFEGQNRAKIYTAERIAEMNKTGKDAKLPGEGAESMTEVGERMYRTTQEIAARLDNDRSAIIFSHGLAIRCLASHIEGWTRQRTFETVTDNTSLTEIIYDNDGILVSYVGATPHFSEESA